MTYQERIDTKTAEIEALTAYANGVTGQSDTTIGDAVKTLCDGYGQGGGGKTVEGSFLGPSNSYVFTIDADTTGIDFILCEAVQIPEPASTTALVSCFTVVSEMTKGLLSGAVQYYNTARQHRAANTGTFGCAASDGSASIGIDSANKKIRLGTSGSTVKYTPGAEYHYLIKYK